MKDFKQNTKMYCEGNHYKKGGKVKKYDSGGEVYLGKAPDRGTIVRDNPPLNSDGHHYWSGSEPSASDKVQKGIGDFAKNTYDTVRGVLTKGALTQSNTKNMVNASDNKKRGGKVTKKKK